MVTTGSGATAVQVIRYLNRKRIIVKHIGSSHDDEELLNLKRVAQQWITDASKQLDVFSQTEASINNIQNYDNVGLYYSWLYEALSKIISMVGYQEVLPKLLVDLSIIRIIEPGSKLRSVDLLRSYFGIAHRRQNFYDEISKWEDYKSIVEDRTVLFAHQHFQFDYSLLFYDVTTLYFETFEGDDLRKVGFSKENKQQPQILIALMVSKDGFPISYQVFSGNTFEGHTILPVIRAFKKKHTVKHLTIIADAAMLSQENIQAIKDENMYYIVGARLGNISSEQFENLQRRLEKIDGNNIRLGSKYDHLICTFSDKRYKKDKYEMDKQILRATHTIKQPSKNSKTKYIKTNDSKLELNKTLITKNEKLLGIKGYYTNLPEDIANNDLVIERYNELYKIEQAFRISKHDLQSRPIYHYKAEPIQTHILICFIALVVSKFIEIKGETSLKTFVTEGKKVTDFLMKNRVTNKINTSRAKPSEKLQSIMHKIYLPH